MMKVYVFLLCLLAAAAANDEWENFKTTYGRSYVNVQEERYRQSVFHRNQKNIDEHNERFKNGLVTFDLKMNRFGDMTQAEITATMTGRRKLERVPTPVLNYQSAKALLADVDWREKGAVTPVKDQGACGSCWAFSATGALEGQHFLATGELVSLSEQNFMDCSWDYGNEGCDGGLEYEGWKYVRDNGGLDTEEFYPYEAKDNNCRYDEAGIGATCNGPKHIKTGSEVALQEAVQNIGPISVGIDASYDSFSFYSSGVYYEPECSAEYLDHSVLAVGYGEDVNGDEYWIVKNSWDSGWGEEGYIKMARNRDNNCGIATDASYPLV